MTSGPSSADRNPPFAEHSESSAGQGPLSLSPMPNRDGRSAKPGTASTTFQNNAGYPSAPASETPITLSESLQRYVDDHPAPGDIPGLMLRPAQKPRG